jgi:transcriptional regulator with XRE-family HTH domain
MSDVETVGRNLIEARTRRRLTQSELGELAGVHFTEISRIERGLRDPRLTTLIRLARALKLRPARLLDGI